MQAWQVALALATSLTCRETHLFAFVCNCCRSGRAATAVSPPPLPPRPLPRPRTPSARCRDRPPPSMPQRVKLRPLRALHCGLAAEC